MLCKNAILFEKKICPVCDKLKFFNKKCLKCDKIFIPICTRKFLCDLCIFSNKDKLEINYRDSDLKE